MSAQEQARRRLRALAASFVVTVEGELSEVDNGEARRRLLRYYLVGADLVKRQLRSVTGEPALAEKFPDTPRVPVNTPGEAIDWVEQEWTNLLAVVEAGLEMGQDREIVQLARMASEFAEGTR